MTDDRLDVSPVDAPTNASFDAPATDRLRELAGVVATHERSLRAYVAHLLGGREGAADIVQEAFARLCEPRHANVALPEWLFVVARNLAIDRLRKEGGNGRPKEHRMSLANEVSADVNGHETSLHSIADDPRVRLERADESRRLIDLLSTLPARQQEAVRLKFQQGLSYAQIATVMQTNANNVAVLIHTGLKALRERMGE